MSPPNEVVLEAESVSKHFGGTRALDRVSFSAAAGEIVGLIGPNGAGKSTLLNVLCGVLRPEEGRVLFLGREITGLKPHLVARLGVARTLQIPRSFPSMTVLENVAVGALFARPERYPRISSAIAEIEPVLELVGLAQRRDSPVTSLNLQERKLLELARALAMSPRLLLIDEAMSGLNPSEIEEAKMLIRRMRDRTGVTVVWVEHLVKAVMALAERIVVLHFGRVIAVGRPEEIARDQAVIDAYLGGAAS